jgi:hypothetical protein
METTKNTKSLLKLAKGATKTKAIENITVVKEKVVAVAASVKPKEPVVLTREDKKLERDRKAKETVQNLLSDIDLNPSSKKVVEPDIPEAPKLISKVDENRLWLEEQVSLLTEQNELLKIELSKRDGANNVMPNGNGAETYILQKTVELFLELQDRHLKWGRNFIIHPKQFMNRLIEFFPYLSQYKTFMDD